VLVLAAVNDFLHVRLKRAAGNRFQFVAAHSWEEAVDTILRRPVEMAVVDPALSGEARTQEIERIRVLFPSLPVILYGELSPKIARVLLKLGNIGINEAVMAGYDDHPAKLGDLLVAEATRAISGELVSTILKSLEWCPGQLRWAIETIIREPGAVLSVQDLADRARMDRRTCGRWFVRAGLPPPSVMLMVLRVLYAHRLLQDPGYTVEDVASKLGYSQTRTLAQNVKEVFGVTPGELRIVLSQEEAVSVVRERYLNQADEELVDAS
jgi:AraC-like DNA-binding protein